MKAQTERKSKAKELERFLKFITECEGEYDNAFDEVGTEDKKLQDILHEMEFAPDKAARNRTATKLHNSRVNRRRNKDIVLENKEIVEFFRERKKVFNEMRELLGRQRKQEDYLKSERTYNPRVDKEEATTKLNEIKALQAFGNGHK